ncbi:uncharacterized protein LOC109831479 isoform X2 [Asparagus officinalis]|uniref:uncharacterized protein LOC109831479 isoform X2 n=1 Tax=Asparagus officinalis TaxID=4686 RepID=UPI00098E07FD|nr:uncharacterized protein LOC109831479 isoform X2 [Asparagus officinalis]
MNFLLSRSTHHVSPDLPSISELHNDEHPALKRTTTLEGLIADDPFQRSSSEEGDRDSDGIGDATGAPVDSNLESQVPMGVLPDDWSDASDIPQLRSLDRSFVFPGEQIHLLVCLSASKQHTEIITPFKVAAVISKNNYSGKNQTKTIGEKANSLIDQGNMNDTYEETADVVKEENGENISTADSPLDLEDISLTESLLRMEDHKHQTEALLESFRNSNFFVRIAHLDEPLWSKRNGADPSSSNSDMAGENFHSENIDSKKVSKANLVNAVIDRGGFDGSSSGGMARNDIRCYSLHNGDIVVLLQVNVAVSNIKDPVLEVIQFEKYEATSAVSENLNGLHSNSEDPCRDLLNWLLPLDRTLPPRPLSPPSNSSSVLGVTQRSTSASSSSQIFSFGHFRSNSMPSLPQVNVPPSSTIPASYSKPSFEVDDYDRISQEKVIHQDRKNSELLSFRGVPLEPERFSVHCGLEGIYLPRRRWRRKVEIIQPIEIHSFAAECSIEDLLCVQVKNVTPAHLPDVTIFLDSIAIIFDEASKGGPPLSLPIASIETGNGHSLPNLSLRRGEEHSFILKPAATVGKDLKGHGDRKPTQLHQKMSYSTSNAHMTPRVSDPRKVSPSVDQYAVLVSCRCNYTESKLFFKQPTIWRPRIARDLMISVVSEISGQTVESNGRLPQLPVQAMTLQASNLTSEDLTLTVLAPATPNTYTSVMPLNSAPSTPQSTFVGVSEGMGRVGGLHRLSSMPVEMESQKESNTSGKRSISLAQHTGATSDVMSNSDLGCSHLWLQSTVPLGCVPAGSSAMVKLELLPLTDGIITLSTLEVAIKEKGVTYRPEQPLKIHATSSVSTGIV